MKKSILKKPFALFFFATVLALVAYFFDNENVFVMLRLTSFVIYLYFLHKLFKKFKKTKK